ncbi:MAG: metallophosphoesterase [Halobacteriales archaeon]
MSDRDPGPAGATAERTRPDRWFSVRERAVYLPGADALVLADLHLGRSRTANVELPLPEREAIQSRLAELVETFEPGTVVLAGDVCHSFSTIPEGVAGTFEGIRDRAEAAGAAFVVVRGNHDVVLDSLADPVSETRLRDGTVVHHGHEQPDADAERYVIGHDHPAIEIEGVRYPCLLWGEETYRGGDVLVLPAFTELAAGRVINGMRGRDMQSPLLSDLDGVRPVVREDEGGETLVFPPLGAFREFL